jgi:hypothetical protein
MEDGKLFTATLQLDAFIQRVSIDMAQCRMTEATRQSLIDMAAELSGTVRKQTTAANRPVDWR